MRRGTALHAAFLCIGLTLSATSAAQSGPPVDADTPQISDRARQLYVDGMKAAEAKNWAVAHTAFLEAWKLGEHYQIAANLGSMEIKLGRYRDAAEHLAIYLRKAPQDKVKDRMRAMAFYEEAKKKVGTVQVTVNVNGAEILVDDKVVALSPILDDIFVDPGPRSIKVRMQGYKPMETAIEASAGSTHQVPVTLAKAGDAAPPVMVPEEPPKPPPPPAEEPFKPARPIVITGIAVGAVGILGGIIFTAVANGQASDAESRATSLRAESMQTTGNPYACATGVYAIECDKLRDLRSGQDTFGNLAVASFVTGIVAGAGTAVYALVLPRVLTTKSSSSSSSEQSSPSPPPGPQARLVPVVTPGMSGVVMAGSF
jgi:hypothetical protein